MSLAWRGGRREGEIERERGGRRKLFGKSRKARSVVRLEVHGMAMLVGVIHYTNCPLLSSFRLHFPSIAYPLRYVSTFSRKKQPIAVLPVWLVLDSTKFSGEWRQVNILAAALPV